MLRLFRHKRKQPMEQSKNVQYLKYALGEVILVVLGVVIALQLNNWNQERINRNEEERIIKDLLVEFEENKEALDFSVNFQKQRIALHYKILSTEDMSIYSVEQLDTIITAIGTSWTFNASLGIYNSLINSGKLDLIKNAELKNKIAKFKDAAIDYSEDEKELLRRTHFDLVQWYHNLDAEFDPMIALGLRKRSQKEVARDKELYLEILENPKYLKIVLTLLTYLQSFEDEGDDLVRDLDEIIEMLKMEAEN